MNPSHTTVHSVAASRANRRGFTLTELLVVIGGVAVVAALTVGAVTRAKRTARNAQCASNLRQVGLAMGQFVTDHGEYPLDLNGQFLQGRYPEHHTTWISAIQKVVNPQQAPGVWKGKQSIFDCPNAEKPTGYPRRLYSDFGYNARGVGSFMNRPSYGLGGHCEGEFNREFFAPPVKDSEVIAPAQMMALGDGFAGWGGTVEDGLTSLWRNPGAEEVAGSSKRARQRHGGRANVYFCDGHMEAPTLAFLFEEKSDEALRKWHRDNQPHRERLVP